jgi:hypothetical protein
MPAPAPAHDRSAEAHDNSLRDMADALETAATMVTAHRRELLRYEAEAESVLVGAALYVIKLAVDDLRNRRASLGKHATKPNTT